MNFRTHPKIIQSTKFFCLHEDETDYNDEFNMEEIEPETIDLKNNLLVQICTNPCYLFLFLCMYSIWLGTYSKRKIYEVLQKYEALQKKD